MFIFSGINKTSHHCESAQPPSGSRKHLWFSGLWDLGMVDRSHSQGHKKVGVSGRANQELTDRTDISPSPAPPPLWAVNQQFPKPVSLTSPLMPSSPELSGLPPGNKMMHLKNFPGRLTQRKHLTNELYYLH